MSVEQRGVARSGPVEVHREIRERGRVYDLVVSVTDEARAELSFVTCDEDGRVLSDIRGAIVLDDLKIAARMIADELYGLVGRPDGPPQSRSGRTVRPEVRAYAVADMRRVHPNAYKPWTPVDDERLRARFGEGASYEALAEEFGRRPSAVVARLQRLGELVGPSTEQASDADTTEDAMTTEVVVTPS